MIKEVVAFSYSRKSPDEKEDTERSINNQINLHKTTSIMNKWDLKDYFSDKNISGSDRNRKGLKDCIEKSKEYKLSNPEKKVYIIVKDQYRFSRDSAFFQDTLRDLEAYGIKVFSVIKNDFLSHEDLGDNVLSLVSQEAIKKGRKDSFILQEKKIQEKLPCIPAPFGYTYNWIKNKKGEKKKIDNNFDMQQWVKIKKESNIVKNVINDYLNSVDYKETIKYNKLTKTKYYRIIKNCEKGVYSGYCVFNKKYKDSNNKTIREEEIKYEINCYKIISEEIYNQVRNKNHSKNNKFLT